MWLPKTIHTRKTLLNLRSSGQNSIEVTELFADETRISNGVELNNWGDDPVQLIVCDGCGTIQCNSGNWAMLRKAGKFVLFIPSFEDMLQGDWEFDEFAPPYFMKKLGAVILTEEQYKELRRLVPQIPQINLIKPLTLQEIAWLIQWEAPDKILGEFPDIFQFKKETLLATNQESDEVAAVKLVEMLKDAASSKETVELIPIFDQSAFVSFFLDGFTYTEWCPMLEEKDTYHLILAPGFQVNLSGVD
jgi:hypothetical protein